MARLSASPSITICMICSARLGLMQSKSGYVLFDISTDPLGTQQHFYQHSSSYHVTSSIKVQRDNSFLRPALEARHIGNTRCRSTLLGPSCLRVGRLTHAA